MQVRLQAACRPDSYSGIRLNSSECKKCNPDKFCEHGRKHSDCGPCLVAEHGFCETCLEQTGAGWLAGRSPWRGAC